MGSRAGFAIKRDGKTRVYGSRQHGSSTVSYLLCGPEEATKRMSNLEEMEEVEDLIGGEDGAALIDWDAKVVLWTMANCHLPVQQRLCNQLIGQAFAGWSVHVCTDFGPYEMLDHLEHDLSEYFRPIDPSEMREHEDEFRSSDACWQPGEVATPIEYLHDFDGEGCWVSVRSNEGTWRDHFGFSFLSNCVLHGERFAKALEDQPTISEIPHELITTDGMVIDWPTKTISCWNLNPISDGKKQIADQWPGWTFQEVPGNQWLGQVELTGRIVDSDRRCPERMILAATIKEYYPTLGNDGPLPLLKLISFARVGCVGITTLFLVAAIGFYWLTESLLLAGLFVGISVACLWATVKVYVKSRQMVSLFNLDFDYKGLRESLDQSLQKLGYPSVDELVELGELRFDDDEKEGEYEGQDT